MTANNKQYVKDTSCLLAWCAQIKQILWPGLLFSFPGLKQRYLHEVLQDSDLFLPTVNLPPRVSSILGEY